MAEAPPISPDGRYYWDGTTWRSLLSADGATRWNGRFWEPVDPPPPAAMAAVPAPSTAAEALASPSTGPATAAAAERPSWLPTEMPMPVLSNRYAAPVDPAEPAFVTLAPPPPSLERPPPASRLPIGALVGGGLAVVAVIGILLYGTGALSFLFPTGSSGSASTTGAAPAETVAPTPSPTPTPETDATRAAMAESVVLTPDQVGQLWTSLGGQPATADALVLGKCMADFPAYQAGFTAQYAWLADGSGHDHGWMSSSGRVVADPAVAAAMQQRVASGGDDSCLAQTFASQVANCGCLGGATSVGTPVLVHTSRPFSLNGTAIDGLEITAKVPFNAVQGRATMYIDFFRLHNGRLVANLAFFAPQVPVIDVQVDEQLQAVEQKVAAAQP